jgi:hypothetical protein
MVETGATTSAVTVTVATGGGAATTGAAGVGTGATAVIDASVDAVATDVLAGATTFAVDAPLPVPVELNVLDAVGATTTGGTVGAIGSTEACTEMASTVVVMLPARS